MEQYFLVLDVGGTNIRFAIVDKKADKCLYETSQICNDFPSIFYAIKSYLDKKVPKEHYPTSCIIAIAAAILSDTIVMTNHNWTFSINELRQLLGFKHLKIVNDFEAQAYCIPYLTKDDVLCIKGAKNNTVDKRISVIAGPGTGLGICVLYKTSKGDIDLIGAEHGHTIIGSYNKIEQQVFDYLSTQKGIESYAESVISGLGIINIYNALCFINNQKCEALHAEEIVQQALLGKNQIARQSLELFFNFLGTWVSNIACSYLPYGGIYLTGGILPKLIEPLQKSGFVSRVEQRALPTVKAIVDIIPIYVILRKDPAILGLSKRVITDNFFD